MAEEFWTTTDKWPRKSWSNSLSLVAWSAAYTGSSRAGPSLLALIIPYAQYEPLQLQSLGRVSNCHQKSSRRKHSFWRATANKEGKEVFQCLQHRDLHCYRYIRPKSCSGTKLLRRRPRHGQAQMHWLCLHAGTAAPRQPCPESPEVG